MGARGNAWGRRASLPARAERSRGVSVHPERSRGGDAARSTLAAAALTLALPLAACAAPGAYMGINLTPGAADPHIQTLARCAMRGDSARAGCPGGASAQKAAQLALGIAYEEGKGLPQDPKRARKLYRAAATPSGGTIYVYVPATRKGGKGSVMPVNMGPRVEGLAEAWERLSGATGCGLSGAGIFGQFAAQGHLCDPSRTPRHN